MHCRHWHHIAISPHSCHVLFLLPVCQHSISRSAPQRPLPVFPSPRRRVLSCRSGSRPCKSIKQESQRHAPPPIFFFTSQGFQRPDPLFLPIQLQRLRGRRTSSGEICTSRTRVLAALTTSFIYTFKITFHYRVNVLSPTQSRRTLFFTPWLT